MLKVVALVSLIVLPFSVFAKDRVNLPPAPAGVQHIEAVYRATELEQAKKTGIKLPENYVYAADQTELLSSGALPAWLEPILGHDDNAKAPDMPMRSGEMPPGAKLSIERDALVAMLGKGKAMDAAVRESLQAKLDSGDALIEVDASEFRALVPKDAAEPPPPPREFKSYARHFEVAQQRDGQSVAPPSLRDGQWLIVQYWAQWCAPCIAEAHALVKAFESQPAGSVVWMTVEVDLALTAQ